MEPINLILDIQRQWLENVKSLAGLSVKQALDVFSKLMFIEPSQFILEFLQNAEDARFELKARGGFFRIELLSDSDKVIKVIIEHNGKPFSDNDVRNLCSIYSSKRPSMGYKGYIGIGWKSVFKVSSMVEVHSDKYHFMFSKNYWFEDEHAKNLEERYGLKPSEVPWQVVPIPINPIEYTPPTNTRFVIYLDNPSYYDEIANALNELKPHVFLFLEYINRIEIIDNVKNSKRVIEWFINDRERINDVRVQEVTVNYYENDQARVEKFLVFRKEFEVPREVREDPTTVDAKRNDVVKREVAIAFALDVYEERVKPIREGQFWGVYSFLPLHEVRSGLPFLIQADFIVHPGRRYINYEARWNYWLMQCVAELTKTAINYLKQRYKRYYLEVFDYREVDDLFFQKMVKPTVISVIDRELNDPEVLCIKGDIVKLSSVVKFDDDVARLIKQGIIDEKDLKYIYGSEKHFLDPNVKLRPKDESRVDKLDILKLLNKNLITAKMNENLDNALRLLKEIYISAYNKRSFIPSDQRFVITSSGEIKVASEVYYSELPKEVHELMDKFPEIREYIRRLDFMHEKLAEYLSNVQGLVEWIGVKRLNFKEVCEKILLPKIYADNAGNPPPKDDLVMITAIIKRAGLLPSKPIWVVTTNGNIRKSSDVYYPTQDPKSLKLTELLKELGLEFLDLNEYFKYDNDVDGWRRFFTSALIRGSLDPMIKPCDQTYRDYEEVINRIRDRLNTMTDKDAHMRYLRALKQLYQYLSQCWKGVINVRVLTDDGRLVPATECLLHDDYNPTEKWVVWKTQGFTDIGPFISPEYLESKELNEVTTWHDFLTKALGVRERASEEDVERFALWYAEKKLMEKGYDIKGRRGEGYDLEITDGLGRTIYVEVKGRRELGDIEFTEKETQKAMELRKNYWLIVVKDLPNNPRAILIEDPASLLTKLVISKRQLEEKGKYLD